MIQARVSTVTATPNHSIQVYVMPKVQLKKLGKQSRIRPEKQQGRIGELQEN